MVTLEDLDSWLLTPVETERLEFKEAKFSYDKIKLMQYCVALANEGGGHLILGVSNQVPRQVVGTTAFLSPEALNDIKSQTFNKLKIRVDVFELFHSGQRVLIFRVPSRPVGQPLMHDGQYLMRIGEDLVSMTPDVLKRIMFEDREDWFFQDALSNISSDDVISLLDTQTYFDLIKMPYPLTRDNVLIRFQEAKFIRSTNSGWSITNLGAVLLAKNLSEVSNSLGRKAARIILYDGNDKTKTIDEKIDHRGYAISFPELVDFVHVSAPQNRFIEEVRRIETKMFPKQAIRELIANALVHQDFLATGASVMIEMYIDRVEISNPGIPPIKVERFLDEYRSRNETLADLMRRFGICEEKGSGIDKVVMAAEVYQLPAPDFRVSELRTTTILFAHQNFAAMSKTDRIRACYQHCALQYISNQRMTNQSLRGRFGFDESKNVVVSQIIGATKEAGFIKQDSTDSASTRYARYVPFWA
jgi:ATP-dependent DNA helicase RecG